MLTVSFHRPIALGHHRVEPNDIANAIVHAVPTGNVLINAYNFTGTNASLEAWFLYDKSSNHY